MDRSLFFAALRKRDSGVFGTALSQRQVDGIDAILDASSGLLTSELAYVLATAYWETGRKVYPNRENMNYSAGRIPQVFGPHRLQGRTPRELAGNPKLLATTVYGGSWGEKNLGNRKGTNDGWKYRGGGMDHTTGYANYLKAERATGLPLVARPELITEPETAAQVIVAGMRSGWYRGRKLADYFGGQRNDYRGARAIINADGNKNGAKIASIAMAFETALRAGGHTLTSPAATPRTAPERPVQPQPDKLPTVEQEKPASGFLAAILRLFAGIGGRT